MKKLTKNEEQLLKAWEATNNKWYKRALFFIGIWWVLLVALDLHIGLKFYNDDPIKSRDHFWLAGLFASCGIIFASGYIAARRFFTIIQKFRK